MGHSFDKPTIGDLIGDFELKPVIVENAARK